MINPPDLRRELRIRPHLVMALLPVGGTLLAAIALNLPSGDQRLLNLPPLLWGLSAMVWMLHAWHPLVGRWVLCATLAGLILSLDRGFGISGSLPLLAIPTALATGLVGVGGAIAFAAGETVSMVGLGLALGQSDAPAALVPTLVLIWSMVLITAAFQRPALELARWSWEEYARSRAGLEEARDRQVQLKRANEDLAYANRQLTLLNEKVAILRRAAEESERAKAIFVANVSHELRTPLNVIIGLADVMIESPDIYPGSVPEAFMDDLEVVHRNCEHLASIVDDVLDLSRLEAERMTLHRERAELTDIAQTALSAVQPLLDRKGLWLRTVLPPNLVVDCDPVRIRQVILNLVSNAARFTEKGGITLSMSLQDQTVQVNVTDTGSGVAPDALDHLFEPFYRAAEQRNPSVLGTGLGLSISKRFVELHGGKMWVDSQLGVGSTFSFDLPVSALLAPISSPTRWQVEHWVERSAPQGLDPARLENRIVVCDQRQSRELCQLFGRYTPEAEYVPTANLKETAQALDSGPAKAVVINAQEPDVLADLTEQAVRCWPDTPIIGTALPSALVHHVEGSSALAYLVKPIRREELRGTLERVLGAVPRTVLVVDDDDDARHVLDLTLSTLYDDVQVTIATCGREALDWLGRERPDVILLDVVMPDMDGWEVLRIVRADPARCDIPTILVSAQDPRDSLPMTKTMQVSIASGLGVSTLLRCMRRVTAIIHAPETEPLE